MDSITIAETNNEVIVSFPFDGALVNIAKSVYPYRWNKTTKTWQYPILIREEVYDAFGLPCPPKRNRASFLIEEKPSPFLLKHQVQCLDIARNNPKYGFYLATGTGKCHGRGTKILMYDGSIKNVEDIEVGEKLMGDDSTPRHVLSLGRGREMMYKITPNKGEAFTVNESHILSLKSTNTHKKEKLYEWKAKYKKKSGNYSLYTGYYKKKHNLSSKFIDMSVRNYLSSNKISKHLLKLYRVPVRFEHKDINIDPYLLGVWLGDGDSCHPVITSADKEIVDYLYYISNTIGCNMVKIEQVNSNWEEKQYKQVFLRNSFFESLKKYNLINNKHVPVDYKTNSKEIRLQLLAGLIDTDGYLAAGTYEIVQKNKKLAEDIVFLSRSLGFNATIKLTQKTIKEIGFNGNYYRIFISGNISTVPVKINRKKAEERKQIKDVLVTGFKIEPIGENEYFGFQLDGNGRYLLSDFTVTHNTVCAGEILKHKKCKAIIVAPLSTLRTVWERIINEFYPEMKYINLYPFKKEDRELIIKKDNSIHIANYDLFKQQYENILEAGYKCLILDESQKLKGITTQISKKLVKFSQQIESAYLLSGTPSPNSRMELYPQIDALSPGLLGYNFYSFRNHYFHALDRNGFKWAENQSTKQDFINRLRKVSISIRKEDCLDLPEKVYEIREVEMTPEQARIYKQMKNQLVADIGDITVVSPTVLTKIMRLRQITSGFIYHNDGSLRFSDSKLKVLRETLEEIGDNQIIIWAVFKEEVRKLLEMIPNSVGVYGDINQDEKSNNIEDFKNGKYQYLIANSSSMAHGQTLVNASYSIYYSLDWSGELWEQSNDRIYRYGQKNQCTYIILCCENTIDTIIYKKLQTKVEDSREIMNHLKQS